MASKSGNTGRNGPKVPKSGIFANGRNGPDTSSSLEVDLDANATREIRRKYATTAMDDPLTKGLASSGGTGDLFPNLYAKGPNSMNIPEGDSGVLRR